jgi:hypothetical protein
VVAVIGDLLTPQLVVDPYDTDTLAALTLIDPDAAGLPLDVDTGDGGHTWTGPLIRFAAEGRWRLSWTVTGTGQGATVQVVDVQSAPGFTPAGLTYATTGDLARHLGGPLPDEADLLLRDATDTVDRLTMSAVYTTDAAGLPVDPVLRGALRDAVCEQVRWWIETGDPTGAQALFSSVSVSGVNIGRAAGGGPAAARHSPRVVEILSLAGLVGAGPWRF